MHGDIFGQFHAAGQFKMMLFYYLLFIWFKGGRKGVQRGSKHYFRHTWNPSPPEYVQTSNKVNDNHREATFCMSHLLISGQKF